MAKNTGSTELLLREIEDEHIRENFFRLKLYLSNISNLAGSTTIINNGGGGSGSNDLATATGVLDPSKVQNDFYAYEDASLTTTDTTVTPIFTESFSEDMVVTYNFTLNAFQTGGTAGSVGTVGSWMQTLTVKTLSGTTTKSLLQNDYQMLEEFNWAVSVSVSTNSFTISVQGQVNKNIKWLCQVKKTILKAA